MTYSSNNPNFKKLDSLFRRHMIARLDELKQAFGVSGRTIFRMLDRIGYLSSYSHTGKYYTLAQTPSFDADGLWAHSGVLFSSHGTLRDTIIYLINKSTAGKTHAELQNRVRLRVHDTLHDLVAAHEIGRTDFESLYLYVSARTETAEAQIAERRRMIASTTKPMPLPDAATVIEVLLAVIHSPKPDIGKIAAFIQAQGKAITPQQIEDVWVHYELGKKKPVSRRLQQ
jgi:hypothetical protein